MVLLSLVFVNEKDLAMLQDLLNIIFYDTLFFKVCLRCLGLQKLFLDVL